MTRRRKPGEGMRPQDFGQNPDDPAGPRHARERRWKGKLTKSQETFAQLIAKNEYPSKAYEKAYTNAKPSSARSNAWRLLKNPNVANRITELEREMGVRNKVSQDEVVAWFRRQRGESFEEGDYSASIKANEFLARCAGVLTREGTVESKGADSFKRGDSDEDKRAVIERLLKLTKLGETTDDNKETKH